MRAVIGHSDEVETTAAIEDALTQCRGQLADEKPKAVLVFMSVDYEHAEVLARIHAAGDTASEPYASDVQTESSPSFSASRISSMGMSTCAGE